MSECGPRGRGPVVVIGAGAVGLGILLPELQAAGHDVVMVARTTPGADRLARGGVPAVGADAAVEAEALLAHAALVVVAVAPRDLASVAPLLARGLDRRGSAVDVLVCDNRPQAAGWLRALVGEHSVRPAARHGFAGALVDRIARRHADDPDQVIAETTGPVYLDARALHTPPPRCAAFRMVADWDRYVTRKLHVFSAGHAAAAYLGMLRGHRRLDVAMQDPVVAAAVRATVLEGQAGLAAAWGDHFAGGHALLEDCLRRYADPRIADHTDRVGRDPARKLAAGDRITGPALAAYDAGLAAPALAVVAAAALVAGRTDPVLGPELARSGPARVLAARGGLPATHPFVEATGRAAGALAARPSALDRALAGAACDSERWVR